MFGIALCFVPLIIAVLFFTLVFKLKISHQLIAVLLGLVAVLPISFIQYFLPEIPFFTNAPLVKTLLKSLILYGLVEELLKLLLAYPLPHKNYTSLNFLLLAFVMGLALGCFESVVYYFEHLQSAHAKGAQILYGMIATRIFSSDLIHMCCMGLSGLFIFSSRMKKGKISCFIFAVLLHGIYDFFVGFPNNLKWFSIVVVLLTIAECRIKYVSLQDSEK
ncbi:MAG: PrsW family intramembrane metalloprotease [Treponema sp.]|nr:PrsW family intramembrane metalloprotease [Treponema sp.]